jgi:hypothetical protein
MSAGLFEADCGSFATGFASGKSGHDPLCPESRQVTASQPNDARGQYQTPAGQQKDRYSTRDVFSALGGSFGGEGLGHDLAVPHDERVRAYLVHVVGSLRAPQNVGIVALDGLLVHTECGTRFAKLRKHRLEQRPNRVAPPERSVRREQDGTRCIVREDARQVALTKTL